MSLDPGESTVVGFALTERDLSQWSTRTDGWLLEPGSFEVSVGASSRDLRLTGTVTVEGPRPPLPLGTGSTLAEWLEHPVGHDLLVDALRTAPGGDLAGMLDDPETTRMLGSFPLSRLVTMLSGALDPRTEELLLGRLPG